MSFVAGVGGATAGCGGGVAGNVAATGAFATGGGDSGIAGAAIAGADSPFGAIDVAGTGLGDAAGAAFAGEPGARRYDGKPVLRGACAAGFAGGD